MSEVKCKECRGTGYWTTVECDYCSGRGFFSGRDPFTDKPYQRDCHQCDGFGFKKLQCWECYGSGRVTKKD